MSTNPTGTLLDENRLLELIETEATTASALAIEMTLVAEFVDAEPDEQIDWDVDEREDEPMLVVTKIPDEQVADAPYPRQLREDDGGLVAPVPDPLVEADPPEGLGLEIDSYDSDRPLLFDAIRAGETVGFVPVRFGDGSPYRAEALPGVAEDSDPVAEETIARERDGEATPRPETVDAPIDPAVFDDVLADSGVDVSESAVVGILEAIKTHDVVGTGDHVAGVPPIAVDGRGVVLLESDAWTNRLAPELEARGVSVADDVLEGAREIHERQTARLINRSERDGDAVLEGEYEPVVVEATETAEWDVSERDD